MIVQSSRQAHEAPPLTPSEPPTDVGRALAAYDAACDLGHRFAALVELATAAVPDSTLLSRIEAVGLARGLPPEDVHEALRLPVPGFSLRKQPPDYVRLRNVLHRAAETLRVDVGAFMPVQLVSARWLMEAGRRGQVTADGTGQWLERIMGKPGAELGEIVEVLRIARLTTQYELGRASGLKKWQIENIAGGWAAHPAQRRAIAAALNIPEQCLVAVPARFDQRTL